MTLADWSAACPTPPALQLLNALLCRTVFRRLVFMQLPLALVAVRRSRSGCLAGGVAQHRSMWWRSGGCASLPLPLLPLLMALVLLLCS